MSIQNDSSGFEFAREVPLDSDSVKSFLTDVEGARLTRYYGDSQRTYQRTSGSWDELLDDESNIKMTEEYDSVDKMLSALSTKNPANFGHDNVKYWEAADETKIEFYRQDRLVAELYLGK